MSADTKKIVQQFWKESATGLPAKTADSDLLRARDFQKKRLEKEELSLQIKAEPCGHFPDGLEVAGWKDTHYRTTMIATTARYHRIFRRKGQLKPLMDCADTNILYSNVTECLDSAISGDDPQVCPSCGAVSTLNELAFHGCAHCGTRFAVSQLYPRVSGYFAVKNFGGTKEEVNAQIFRHVRPFLIAFLIIIAVVAVIGFDSERPVHSVMNGVFWMGGAAVLAFITGYLLWVVRTVGGLFVQAGKSVNKLSFLGSQKKFTRQMKEHSEEFSYEYFTDKVISILKTILYSSKDENLPNYLGEETTQFDHVVESSFTGSLGLKSFSVTEGIVTVHAVTFMENFYHENGRIRKKEEKIPVTVQKDLSLPINYHFNIRAVKCDSCGGSFDALSGRFCPYCGKPTDLRKQDWVITKIGK